MDTTDGTPHDGDDCPVCGQPYDHYRVDEPDGGIHMLRDDAQQCRVETDSNRLRQKTWKVYVHV